MTTDSTDASTIRLRPLREFDLRRVVELEPELFGPQAWNGAMYLEELANPRRHYIAAIEHHPGSGERLVGYAGLDRGQDAQIMTVGVDPARRRRHIATRMMRTLIAEAARRGSERVLLEVRADDEGAQSLYAATGFQPIARRPGYYGRSGQDAIVMARTLHVDADSSRRAEHLVEPGYLAAELDGATPPVVLDVRWPLLSRSEVSPEEEFRAGHIPGARLVDMVAELAGNAGAGANPYPLPDPADLERSARAWGISQGAPVVVTDEFGGAAAARAWWLLRWAGHEDVRVLCGGTPGWRDMDLPVEEGDGLPVAPGDVALPLAHGGVASMPVVELHELADAARAGLLVDTRSAEAYAGMAGRGGHIPGARNMPDHDLLDEEGHIAPVARLRAMFAAIGMDPDRPDQRWTIQCATGMTAPQTVLALAVLGIRARLWPGAWFMWVADASRPVARGSEPGEA